MKKKRGKNKFNLNLMIIIVVVCLILVLSILFFGILFKKPVSIPSEKGELPSGGIFPQGGAESLISSESAPLFTGYLGIYPNDSINKVKNMINSTDLPILLKSGLFSGNVNSNYLQTINLGSYPQLVFAKQPTSGDDPVYGILLSTSYLDYIYNTTITFNNPIDFTAPASKDQEIELFGNKYIVSNETNSSYLVLINSNSGEKIKFENDEAVMTGENNDSIWGTFVVLKGSINSLSEITIIVYAPDSDHDFLRPYENFTDPVFDTFKLDFSGGLNIADDSTTAREDIIIRNVGDDKMAVKFKNYKGDEANINFAKNTTHTLNLMYDDDGKNITVMEKESIRKSGYVMVGNQDEAYLLKVSTITNQSSGYANDKVVLTDVFNSENKFTANITADGAGTITIGGKVYNIYYDAGNADMDLWTVVLDYPDSAATGSIVIYPTIKTSKGALVAFYEPLTINLGDIDGREDNITPCTQLRFPDGDGYADIDTNTLGINSGDHIEFSAGQLDYTLVRTDGNNSILYLTSPKGPYIYDPAIIIIEEKDDNNQFNALIITTEAGATSTDGIGVDDILRTWSSDSQWDNIVLATDSNKAKDADLYGTIALINSTDADQKQATISYPNEQVQAYLYITHDNITQIGYCGDNSCNNGETCSSCSPDCGSCGGNAGGGSSGGGSSGGINPKTYSIKSNEISAGYTQQLNKNDKMVFKIPAETSGGSHSLVVNQMSSNSATMTIMSSPLSLTLKVGESKKLNLTSLDYYDIYVKLESITNNKASITIKTIHEDIPKNDIVTNPPVDEFINNPEENPVKIKTDYYWIFIIIGILVVILVVLLIFKFKIKSRH